MRHSLFPQFSTILETLYPSNYNTLIVHNYSIRKRFKPINISCIHPYLISNYLAIFLQTYKMMISWMNQTSLTHNFSAILCKQIVQRKTFLIQITLWSLFLTLLNWLHVFVHQTGSNIINEGYYNERINTGNNWGLKHI